MPGSVRFRAFQLGVETTFGTPVPATRRMPWRFAPTVNPNWTTPDVDTGTLDPAIAPFRTAVDVTGQSTGPLAGEDAQVLWAALLKGGVSPTGPTDSAYTWQFSPAATSQDPFEIFTGEWGDDTTDEFQYGSGVLDALQLTFPQDLGPIQHQGDWRFATVDYPNPLTGGLDVERDPSWLYAADTELLIDDVAGSIGITRLTDTMHDATIQISNNLDVKRFANGSNANFAVAGYSRGMRTMQTTFTFAKSVAGLNEVAKWLNAAAQERFVVLNTTSRKLIGATSTFQQRIRFAGFWFTRSEAEVGSNSAVQLVCNHIYDPDLVAPIDVRLINDQATIL